MHYGFIGTGNMASAIISGAIGSGRFKATDIYGYNRHIEKAEKLKKECGLNVCGSLSEIIAVSDIIVLAVKPQVLPELLPQMSGHCEGKKIVSIAAGKTLAYFEEKLGRLPVLRVMPNINARVFASTSSLCANSYASKEDVEAVRALFETVGTVVDLPESQFSAFSAVAGASPAFTYIYIDALAKAGVRAGLPRSAAFAAAAGSVLGSAKMAMGSELHPCALADQVCSPGGTTIEGVFTLQNRAFEGIVEDAVAAVIAKEKTL